MITIYDAKEKEFAGNGLIALEPDECKVIHEINGDFSADLVHHHDAQGKWRYIQEQRILRIPTPEGKQLFRIYSVSHDGQTKQMIAKARHIFYDLSDNFLEDVRPTEINGAGAMERISSGTQYAHPFRFGSDVSNISTAYYVRTNPVAALMGAENAVINRWGGELERDNFDVMLRARVGADHGVQIRYGKNMTAISLQYDISKIATRIMPTGLAEDGQTVVMLPEKYIDSKYIERYPHPIVTHIHYSDIKVDTENGVTLNEVYHILRERANAEFEAGIDLPETYGTVSFVDLSTTEQYKNKLALETVRLGDTVTVKNSELDINTKTRVISYTYEAAKGQYDSIEFGQIKPDISTVLERISSVLQDEITIAKSDLQQAIDKATDMLISALGGHVIKRRGEILILDTESPETAQKVWRWNLNGLGYSSSGITGPYSLAITMDGTIVADFITAGVLNGDLLKAGSVKADKINAKGLTVNNGVTDTLRVDENGDVSLNVKSLSITGNQVATQGDLTSGLNGMQIGSRNYIKDSVSRVLTSPSGGSNYLNRQLCTLEQGTQYTFSVEKIVRVSGTATQVAVLIYDFPNNHAVATYLLNISNSKQQITFTSPNDGDTNTLIIYAGVSGSTAGNSIRYEHMKLEKGSKATDWTPAPDDPTYGVNMILNSKKVETSSAYGFAWKELTAQLIAGQKYTLSFCGHIDQQALNDGKKLTCYIYSKDWVLSKSVGLNTTSDSVATLTFIANKTDTCRFTAYLFPDGGSRAGKATLKWCKLEVGDRATDWTPAPEDRAYLVNTLSPTQADGMWLGSDGRLNITATQIKAGRLQSKDGSSYFNLESGEIVSKNTKMAGRFVSTGSKIAATLGNTEQIPDASPGQALVFHPAGSDPFSGWNVLDSYGFISSTEFGGGHDIDINIPTKGNISLNAVYGSIKLYADTVTVNGKEVYTSKNLQSGEAMVPNGSLSGSIYTGETTVYFSPAFSKAPRVSVTPRTGSPYNVTASLGSPPTANSVKIIVQRNTKTADGYTAVQWIAVEPD